MTVRARARAAALKAGFAAARVVPEPVKSAIRRGPLGTRAGRFLASNSVGAADAYPPGELAAALRSTVGEAAPYHQLLDPASRARVLASAAVDLSAADDRETVNALNLLRNSGGGRAWVIPSDALLAESKQAIGPLIHDGTTRTVVRVHNYFAKNYAIKDAILVVLLADTGSALLPLASFVLDADETVTWASGDAGVIATVADGATLVFLAVHPSLRRVPTREFRLIVTVETDRSCAAVHSLPASRFEVAQSASNGTKGYITPETRSLHLGRAVLRWDGERPASTSGGTIDVAAPGGDAAGWGAATCRFEPLRAAPRFYVATDGDDHLLLHHDQGPHPKPERALQPSDDFFAGRELFRHAIPLLHHKDVDLSIVVDPRNMANTYRSLHVEVCDDDGSVMADRYVELDGPLTVIDTADLRRRASLPASACGYVRVTPERDGAHVRELDDAAMLFGFYRADGHLLDTVEAGTSPFADYEPILEDGYRDHRSLAHRANKFATLHPDPEVRTQIWSANVGASHRAGDAPLTLSLRWRGDMLVRRHVLAPGEARLWDIDEEFGLDPGDRPDAAVWLESPAANLFGIYLYDDARDRLRFGLDHLTGG